MVLAGAVIPTVAERRHPDADRWDEYWQGVLHMAPAPNRFHQDLEFRLAVYLFLNWSPISKGRVHQQVNLTTPADEADWTRNYRIPDIVLLDPPRFSIDRADYMVGAPLVVIEIQSPGDATQAKFDFYEELGVPEIWVIGRDTCRPSIHQLTDHGRYTARTADGDGWFASPLTGVELKAAGTRKLAIRMTGRPDTEAAIPD